jgi:uncharacterized repeat protein (TIGR01451 family)
VLLDGSALVGTISFSFELGKPVTAFTETFDQVTAPALPAGWTTSASTNTVSVWVTSSTVHDAGPNAVFADEPSSPGIEDLISPPIPIITPSAQLVFRNNYNTETDPAVATKAYDGGVLEIQIGTNDFADILAAGGTFAAGGYVRTISTQTNDDNPLAGRQVWSGNSGGFMTSVVSLPASAAGQVIRLKWRFALDSGNYQGGSGWYIDSVSVQDGATCCSSSADLAVSQTTSPDPVAPGQGLNYAITVTNLGPSTAYAVMVTNTISGNLIFLSSSPGCFYSSLGNLRCDAGTLASGSSTNFNFVVVPETIEAVTNLIQAASVTPDPNPTNNTSVAVSTIATNLPADVVTVIGAAATFQATAFGAQPLGYQWLLNGAPLQGQTGSRLALTNVQPAQMGAYSVMVTNGNGSIMSAPAQLTVLAAPAFQLSGISATGGSVVISLQSATGRTYTLEYKNLLSDSNWTPILPALPGTGGSVSLQDTNAATLPARFYRVSSQ